MTRARRQVSESGIYHVVLRGISRQLLFEGTEEFEQFIDIVARYRDAMGFSVLAWCLMGNHVHLLIQDHDGVLSQAMKRICITFAQAHNRRTGHVGHVFQDRFHSKPIGSDAQLLACVRYIHDNPQKAGICDRANYRWSSYREYVGRARLADTTLVLGMLDGIEGFEGFSAAEDGDAYEAPPGPSRISDGEAREMMASILTAEESDALEHGTKATRDMALRKLKAAGLSCRQIERLTGVGRCVVQRA